MKKLIISLLLIFSFSIAFTQNIGIGTTNPHPSAALDITDSTKGILIPRMTLQQRIAIVNPAEGLMVYQTDSTYGYYYFGHGSWNSFSSNQNNNNNTVTQTNTPDIHNVLINGVPTTQFIPQYLYDVGDCANGNFTTNGNYNLTSTFASYCNLTIRAGDTFFLPTSYDYIYRRRDNNGVEYRLINTCNIQIKDTLFLNGVLYGTPRNKYRNNYIYGANMPQGPYSTAGGPGGSGRVSGSTNSYGGIGCRINWNIFDDNISIPIYPPIYEPNTLNGGSGCPTIVQPANSNTSILKEAIKLRKPLSGIDGLGEYDNSGFTTNYEVGGLGGVGLYINCRVLSFDGRIILSGESGTTIYVAGYGGFRCGGGGGGGSLVISTENIVSNSGTIITKGGTGFSSVASGCPTTNGGDGAYIIIKR
jgi:hypothetical protein